MWFWDAGDLKSTIMPRLMELRSLVRSKLSDPSVLVRRGAFRAAGIWLEDCEDGGWKEALALFRWFLRVAGYIVFFINYQFQRRWVIVPTSDCCLDWQLWNRCLLKGKEVVFFNFELLFWKSFVAWLTMLMDANGGVVQTSRCRPSERVKQTDCKLHQLVR